MIGVTYLKSEQCQKSWPKQDTEARKESSPESFESMGLLTPGRALSESGPGGHTMLLFGLILTWRTHTAAVCLEATHFGSLLQQALFLTFQTSDCMMFEKHQAHRSF